MSGVLDENLGRVLIREVPGCIGLVSTERLSGGASQETYKLKVTTAKGTRLLCLRRAPGGPEAEVDSDLQESIGLPTEALLISKAGAALVPEPKVHYVLRESDSLGEWFVMEWLEGETLGSRIVRSREFEPVRPRLAQQCGEILARIHAIELETSGLLEKLTIWTPEDLVRQTWERYKRFNTPQPMIDYAARWLLEHLPVRHDVTLVHNDFRNGNLMVDPTGIVGVLDWELAHVGDPMHDVGWLCTNSWRFGQANLTVGGFGNYEDLASGYESISGRKLDREHVRFWEVYGSFWWAVTTLVMVDQFRVGPDKSVERAAIGRRCSEAQIDCVNLIIKGPVKLVDPPDHSHQEMPGIAELLVSVRDFLRGDVMDSSRGRTQFLARVAGNSLDIIRRDRSIGGEHRRLELERLRTIFASQDDLADLQWRLVNALRDASIPMDHEGVIAHLRDTVANQVAIDQPGYSGLATALGVRD